MYTTVQASDGKTYKVADGTFYNLETPDAVIDILEMARESRRGHSEGQRLIMEYGDTATGQHWSKYGSSDTGYIGRSMGSIKIPIAIYNARSHGGEGLLEHCIVRILTTNGKRVLYQHPTYQAATE